MGIDLNVAAGGAKATAKAQDALYKAQDAVNAVVAKSPDALKASSKAHAAYEVAAGKVEAAQKKLSDTQSAGGQIIGALSERFSGQASAAADTMAGRMANLKANGEDLLKTLGEKLIPVVDGLVKVVQRSASFLEQNRGVAIALAAVVGGVLATAFTVWAASLFMVDGALSPIVVPMMIIIGVIAHIAAAINELYTPWKLVWEYIGPIVNTAWGIIKPIFDTLKTVLMVEIKGAITLLRIEFEVAWALISTAINVAWAIIKPVFDIIKTVISIDIKAAIEILRGAFDIAWTAISGAIKVAWAIIQPIWDLIKGGIADVQTVAKGLGDAWDGIWKGLGSAVTSAYNTYIKPAIDVVTGAVNAVKGAWDFVFGGGGSKPTAPKPPATPSYPGRASGGPVSSLSTYLVGEQGPELFTPSSSGTITPNHNLGGSGGQAAQVYLQIDGKTLATLMLPSLQTTVLQAQRSSSVPIFGSVA
jgi:phage-related protein